MGLDMYLYRKTYVKNWDHMSPEEKHQITVAKGGKATHIKPEKISEITEEVAYWRKANQIHKWFVDNVQGGEDDCREYYVSRDQLVTLLDLCKKVVATARLVDGKIKNGETLTKTGWEPIIVDGKFIQNGAEVEELLPTQGGFFFGGTDYDEYYYEDIKHTIEALDEILSQPKGGSFYYNSSW